MVTWVMAGMPRSRICFSNMQALVIDQSQRWLAIIAIAAILPIATFAAMSFVNQLPEFFNSCFTWGMVNGGTLTVSPAGPCTAAGGSSETIPQAILTLILIPGGILLASSMGVIGVFRSRQILMLASSMILFLESIPFVFDGL